VYFVSENIQDEKTDFVLMLSMSNLQAQERPKLVVGIVVDQMKRIFVSFFQ
jgi:hypothetical protein